VDQKHDLWLFGAACRDTPFDVELRSIYRYQCGEKYDKHFAGAIWRFRNGQFVDVRLPEAFLLMCVNELVFDGETMLAYGENGLLRSRDGRGWEECRFPLPADEEPVSRRPESISFWAPGRAYLSLRSGRLLKTVNSGGSWAIVAVGPIRGQQPWERFFTQMAFLTETNGAALYGGDTLVRTRDGGASWVEIGKPFVELRAKDGQIWALREGELGIIDVERD
jgi:photosystem II stability/assembly factor-like uncharacterized protein